MAEYRFMIDRKVTSWEREYHTIEANSQEEADSIAIAIAKNEVDNEVDEYETIGDTTSEMTPAQNGGCSTVEVIREHKNFGTIWENGENCINVAG